MTEDQISSFLINFIDFACNLILSRARGEREANDDYASYLANCAGIVPNELDLRTTSFDDLVSSPRCCNAEEAQSGATSEGQQSSPSGSRDATGAARVLDPMKERRARLGESQKNILYTHKQ